MFIIKYNTSVICCWSDELSYKYEKVTESTQSHKSKSKMYLIDFCIVIPEYPTLFFYKNIL